jgi:hypothetical protein
VKRIYVVGAAMAALLTAGTVTAPARARPAGKPPATVIKKTVTKLVAVKTNVTCDLKLVTQVPSNGVSVTQGARSGTQYGRAGCGTPLFSGVEQSSFHRDQAGNLQGMYQQWFNAGSIFGEYALTATHTGPPTTTSSTSAAYTGTVTVTNGTGEYKKAAATGTLACSTTDLAHYTCTERLKLVQQVLTTVTTTKKTATKK